MSLATLRNSSLYDSMKDRRLRISCLVSAIRALEISSGVIGAYSAGLPGFMITSPFWESSSSTPYILALGTPLARLSVVAFVSPRCRRLASAEDWYSLSPPMSERIYFS